jgi:predicted RNase H-related nuclease YkuK (DUF458 family)
LDIEGSELLVEISITSTRDGSTLVTVNEKGRDNAGAESFFKTLKVEHIYHNNYKTFKEAELSVFEYIEAWYNVNRIHTTIKTSIKNKKEILINQLVA